MKNDSGEQLWERLLAARLVSGATVPVAVSHSPWFVRAMLGVAGWIGALFFIGFIGASLHFILQSSAAALITGMAVCTGAVFIFRNAGEKDFIIQFGLATSFAGQALFISGLMGLFSLKDSLFLNYMAIALFEAALTLVIQNSIHRVLSTFTAAVSLSLALTPYGFQHAAPAMITLGIMIVWLNEMRWVTRGTFVRPVGYGLVLAAVLINSALLMHEPGWLGGEIRPYPQLVTLSYWAGIILNGAVLIFAVWRLLVREGLALDDRMSVVALIGALAAGISSFKAPGITTGLIIVLLGYANGNRVLAGFGIIALIIYLSHYYYQLQTTLLIKSVSLIATGLILLLVRFALARVCPENERRGGDNA